MMVINKVFKYISGVGVLTFLFFFMGCNGNQGNNGVSQEPIPENIKIITSKFTSQQLDDFVKKINFTVPTMDSLKAKVPEGGELTAFYSAMGLNRIDAYFKAELGEAFETYHLLGNQLFAYRQVIHKKANSHEGHDHSHEGHHHEHEHENGVEEPSTEMFEVLFSEGKVLEARVGDGVKIDQSNIDYVLESMNVYAKVLRKQTSRSDL